MISSWPAGSGFDHASQRADVVAIDLVERAVALRVVGTAVHQPVRGVGLAQHRVGDGRSSDARSCGGLAPLRERRAREQARPSTANTTDYAS